MVLLNRNTRYLALVFALIAFLNPVSCWRFSSLWSSGGLKCYQCSSHNNLDCADNAVHEGAIEPQDCSHIFEAKYCIKMVGRNQGVYGTSRQCSSVDLGNYCDYVKQVGDAHDYRSCVYTCDSDGCNAANGLTKPSVAVLLMSVMALFSAMYLL